MVDTVLDRRRWNAALHRRRNLFSGSWNRRLGKQHSRRVGVSDRQFRLVDRVGTRRDFHLRISTAAGPAVEIRREPPCRDDDDLRSDERVALSAPPPRSPVVLVLVAALPRDDGRVAQLQELAHLGSRGDIQLLHGLVALLVSGYDPGSRRRA